VLVPNCRPIPVRLSAGGSVLFAVDKVPRSGFKHQTGMRTYLAQYRSVWPTLGSLASKPKMGVTQPCVLPSSKHPNVQRCQSVRTQ
jgi:hypothetical protein